MNSRTVALLAIATLFIAVPATSHVHLHQHHVDASSPLCSHSLYPSICNHIAAGKPNAVVATSAVIQTLITKTTLSKSLSKQYEAHGDAFTKQLFNTCGQTFDSALSDLEDAFNYVKSGDQYSLNDSLSAVLSYYVTCDDGFLEESGSPLGNGSGHANPLAKTNSQLMKLASVALGLSKGVH